MTQMCPESIKPEELSFDKKASIICKLEEALLYAISKDDISAYLKVAEIYIVKLAQFQEYNKVRQFLLEDLWKHENEKDYLFLKKQNVNIKQLVNQFKILISGIAVGGNQTLLEIVKEIEELTDNLNFISTESSTTLPKTVYELNKIL